MTDKQPEALRLADEFDATKSYLGSRAAAELRRLHEVNVDLVSLLKEVLHYSKHVSNVAYNLGQHHDQWGDSIWPSIERLDRASRTAKAALAKATGENND